MVSRLGLLRAVFSCAALTALLAAVPARAAGQAAAAGEVRKLIRSAALLAEPSAEAARIGFLGAGDQVVVLGRVGDDFFHVRFDTLEAYLPVSDFAAPSTAPSAAAVGAPSAAGTAPPAAAESPAAAGGSEAAAEASDANDRDSKEAEERQRLYRRNYSRYGREVADRIAKRQIWGSMNMYMAEASIGRPDEKTRGEVAGLRSEVWRYHKLGIELIFENGHLVMSKRIKQAAAADGPRSDRR